MNADTPPDVRPLPRHDEYRRELLAAIRAESGTATRPRKAAGRLAWLNPWVGPVAAAAVVLAVAVAVAAVHGLVRTGNGSPGAGQARQSSAAAAGSTVTGTVPVTTQPVPAGGAEWKVSSSFEVTSPVTSLVVDDPTGSVTFTSGDTSRVSVTAVIYYVGTAPAVTRNLSAARTLRLGYSGCGDCGVGFRITVPSGVSVRVTEGTGDVTLTGIQGSVDVRARAGSVTATGLGGRSDRFRVSTGRIDATFATPPTRIDAVVGTGSVAIQVPSSTTYQVSASAGLGATNVAVPQAAHAGHVITATANTGSIAITGEG